jgi:Ca2+-binding RTX toxin-like protein
MTVSMPINWSDYNFINTPDSGPHITDGADQITGTRYTSGDPTPPPHDGNDVIFGGGGNDVINAKFGNDIVDGGAESDKISGG